MSSRRETSPTPSRLGVARTALAPPYVYEHPLTPSRRGPWHHHARTCFERRCLRWWTAGSCELSQRPCVRAGRETQAHVRQTPRAPGGSRSLLFPCSMSSTAWQSISHSKHTPVCPGAPAPTNAHQRTHAHMHARRIHFRHTRSHYVHTCPSDTALSAVAVGQDSLPAAACTS